MEATGPPNNTVKPWEGVSLIDRDRWEDRIGSAVGSCESAAYNHGLAHGADPWVDSGVDIDRKGFDPSTSFTSTKNP